jgi:NADPH:quinone reductase-like Zn-dependent oxidoreductase
MRAFAPEELGKPGSVVEVPVPGPAEGQVRIRVVAAGLNPFDNAVIRGFLKDQMEHRFPLIPGGGRLRNGGSSRGRRHRLVDRG